MDHKVSPSLLSADFSHLADDIEMLNRSEADWIHLDIMDGVFVPNISFGFPVLKHVAALAAKPLDVHLMIVEPQKFIREIKDLGAMMMNVHYEACVHLHRVIGAIKEAGMKAGVTLNPSTPVMMLSDVIRDVDLVLLMGVNPGFGGQKFIESSYRKIEETARLKEKYNRNLIIEVDGGVSLENTPKLLSRGANALVAGNAIFSATDPKRRIEEFKRLAL